VCLGQNSPQVSLDTNQTLFAMLTAINACGYDTELNASNPLRLEIREEVAKATQTSDQAREETDRLCNFYHEHAESDPVRIVAPYVSLALLLDAPPDFTLKVKEEDLPPDAMQVVGILPTLRKFYDVVGLDKIWARHQDAYASLTASYHEPLSKLLFDTEIYLKLPSSGYLGHSFSVYLEPMGAPGETNARNYGSDYYVVISPGASPTFKMEQIRHTYLHYLLDPLAMKHAILIEGLAPLLDQVKRAPMDQSFKKDISLLVTESFIRAIEARTSNTGKTSEAERQAAVQRDIEQGYVLTAYFYDTLVQFEKSPTGLRNAYGDIIGRIDLHKEQKRASNVRFAPRADPELVRFSQPSHPKLLVTAEQRLSAGDADSAKKLAQEALDNKTEDAGRALFILAQVATMNRDMQGARHYFEQALGVAREPKVVAWSHIYLGRILDLQEDRAGALDHYRLALSAGASLPEAKAAAEHGLHQPFELPNHPQTKKD
jgi:tetratricopeptide (TPR) repeat protein